MIREKIKKEKGISLVALTITIIVMIILANVIIYNLKDNLKLNNLESMYNDISNLKDKISLYYSEYGSIPAFTDRAYTNTDHMSDDIGVLDEEGDFYVIDLSVLDNLTLNYGKDFETVKKIVKGETSGNINDYEDLYIINDSTHNVFYVEGIKMDNKIYYTDENPDENDFDLLSFSLEDIRNKTFYSNVAVTDNFGNKMVLPAGFKITEGENVTEGIVIQDENGNEFVWIPVGKVYTDEGRTETASKTIELGRYEFANDGTPSAYSGTNTEDTASNHDLTYGNAIAKDIEKFKESVSVNNGYYIGRYEARVEGWTGNVITSNSNSAKNWTGYTNGKLVEKGDAQVFNYITQNKASELSRGMYESDNFESDLINSYAWDTATLFLQEFDNRTYTAANNANYKAKYSGQIGLSFGLKNKGTNSLEDESKIDKICNVYDMAENCFEFSTETNYSEYPCVYRGSAGSEFSYVYTSTREGKSTIDAGVYYSFRPILYIKQKAALRISTYDDNAIGVGNEADENGTVDGRPSSYKNPIIPKGFKAINEGGAEWGTSSGYKKGLVIEDAVEGSETKGCQFVWVPVKNYNDFHLIDGFYNTNVETYVSGGNSKEAGSTSAAGSPISNNVAGTQESIKMYKSVKDNGGFYIARYEAGVSGTTENHSLSPKTDTDGSVKPLSKAGLGVWNSIAWGGTLTAEASDGMQGNDNADGAVKVARSMYNDKAKYGATSTLCYGVQWDAAMTFLDPNYSNGTYDSTSYVKNSAGKGWYSDVSSSTRHTTGYHAENNIYDLAGNVYEWTMEAYGTRVRASRRRLLLR